jgi:ABC-type glycerol-3-phosphate transport system substrate-binding protein
MREKFFKRISLAAISGIAIAALVGCTGPAGADPDAPVTLELWEFINPDGDDPRGMDLKANIDSFEAAHQNVTVEVNVLPWANIDPQLMQAANAGNSPDVVRVLSWDLPKHVAAGNLTPLDDYLSEEDKEDWLLGWDSLTTDGQKWAIPFEYRSPALYYRTDFTGETPPADWDAMIDSADKDGARPGVVVGMSNGAQAAALAEVFVSYLWANGAEVFNEDGTAAFNSKEGIETFELLGSLVGDGIAPSETVSYTYEEVFQSITAGAADYWLLGSHRHATAVATAELQGKLKLAPLPGVDGDVAPAHVFGWTLGIGKDSQHPELAAELIAHMTSAESQLSRVQATGELPTRASVYEDEWFKSPDAEAASMLAAWFEESGRTLNYGEHYVELSQLWAQALQKMALEGASAKDVANEAAEAYDDLL